MPSRTSRPTACTLMPTSGSPEPALRRRWQSSASTASSTVLQEVGFDAQSTGYENPQAVVGTATDPQYLYMQQTWFAMVCEIVHHFNLAGVYFWNLNFNIDPTKVSGDDLSLGPTDWMNRPGATAIASCFANFGSAG